jgi:hypothetical protein
MSWSNVAQLKEFIHLIRNPVRHVKTHTLTFCLIDTPVNYNAQEELDVSHSFLFRRNSSFKQKGILVWGK